MLRLKTCPMLIVVALSAASCATGSASDGAGYSLMHPSSATRQFIFANDPAFTSEVAEHNTQCNKDKACRK